MSKKLLFLVCLFCSIAILGQSKIKVGKPVPEFKLWLTDGERLTQNDIKDKVVVFKFWFTSCLPCIASIPKLNTLVENYKNRDDIIFVAPALDRKDVIEKFVYYQPFDFKIAYSSYDVSTIFNKKQSYPSYFVVNKKGVFTYVDNDVNKADYNALKKAVKEALEN